MACIRERPEAFFRLSPAAAGEVKCFAVRRGDVQNKQIGANIYAPEVRAFLRALERSPFTKGKLADAVTLNPQVNISHLEEDSEVSFVPMEAVENGGTGSVQLSNRQLQEVQKGYTSFGNGDVVWAKITPCMENGKSFIASNLTNGVGFGSTEFHVFRPLSDKVAKEFLHEFLAQETLRHVARYAFTGSAGHQRVPEDFLAQLPFPLPDKAQQIALVNAMNKARTERRAKLAEADALLASLDNYLLETLGLTQPPKEAQSFFAVRRGNLNRRIDAYSNQRRFKRLFEQIHNSQYRVAMFNEFAKRIFSGITPLAKGDAYTIPPDGVRFIRSGEITDDGEVAQKSEIHISEAVHNGMMKRSQLERGDLLVAIVGATIGAVGVFNHDEPANINQAIAGIRLNGGIISSEFACLYLRSSLGQALLDYFKRPVARANINLEEIGEIPVIIPPKQMQNTVVAESNRCRQQVRRLHAEAEVSWQTAKKWFEEQLLGTAKA